MLRFCQWGDVGLFSFRNSEKTLHPKDELMNEEDQGMLITLEDENGQEVEFEFLDVIEFEGTEYIVLIENDEDADEVVILQINQIDEDTEEYVSIDDEDTLNKVFELL